MTSITSKPDHGALLVSNGFAVPRFQEFLDDLQRELNDNLLGAQVNLTSYLVQNLPEVTPTPGLIFVSDAAGGSIPAFSDGSNWRRVDDRTIIL